MCGSEFLFSDLKEEVKREKREEDVRTIWEEEEAR